MDISELSCGAGWGCASSGAARMLVRCRAECQRERSVQARRRLKESTRRRRSKAAEFLHPRSRDQDDDAGRIIRRMEHPTTALGSVLSHGLRGRDCDRQDAMLNFAARASHVRVRTVLSGNERLTLTFSRLIV
jgi:hypothetical protein